jgi:hypothetical protein
LNDGVHRQINRGEYDKYVNDRKYNKGGYQEIREIQKSIEKINHHMQITMVHIHDFKTDTEPNTSLNQDYSLINGPSPFKMDPKTKRQMYTPFHMDSIYTKHIQEKNRMLTQHQDPVQNQNPAILPIRSSNLPKISMARMFMK